MAKLSLSKKQITRVKNLARAVARQIQTHISKYSTESIERTILRLYGVDGVDEHETPLCNLIVERQKEQDRLGDGVSNYFARAMLQSGQDAQTTASLITSHKMELDRTDSFLPEQIKAKEMELARDALVKLDQSAVRKAQKIEKYGMGPQPWRYLIVATGNVYEDRTQARSAVLAGADIIAQIRSTAQSLLDYVPYGPTTQGFGGTFATQANFKIMRKALDEASEKAGRYIRLVNYSSGLCMAEIAACAAFEDLDVLLNDSMYGILFRDINMTRTFVDQHFSRLICARARIIINTGEDNYLTTADAIDQAYTVTASQLINEALARQAMLTDDLIGLGHAFEVDPAIENGFLYELAHAQLARQLFPECPIKYMPPTKYKSTDIFFSHCLDTMFNLASILTDQGIHLAGMLTEAIHTPFMQDRYHSLTNIDYVFKTAQALKNEIDFKPKGFIANRAQEVLDQAEAFLRDLKNSSLMQAISQGKFANISRPQNGGKGYSGVFLKSSRYSNPIEEMLMQKEKIHV